ncbi:MAG: hypothetical protein RI947_1003 [Candidatus Parcubacteria bacterium]|jgi:hypothetical protein
MHNPRSPQSLRNLYVILTIALIVLLGGVYVVNRETIIKPVRLSIQSVPTTDGITTHIYAQAPSNMYIRGYYIPVTFDNSSTAQIKKIVYKLGTVSEGLGSDNTSLSTVNTDRYILLQGESHEKLGTVLPTRKEEVVTIESKGTPSFTIQKEKSIFYKIDKTNELIEVPVILD